ncbi:MAG: hypothetical protein H6Q59_2785 [Firmicutes bacterium]|nr:hypothetical protein [Bacillota bacterium]
MILAQCILKGMEVLLEKIPNNVINFDKTLCKVNEMGYNDI